jgi:hypothetical protein
MGKRVGAIAVAEVPIVFDDQCIHELARLGKLPADAASMAVFGKGLLAAVRTYADAARVPSPNDVRREIMALHRAASRGKYNVAADLIESLSPTARDWLIERLNRPAWRAVTLPDAGTLRDPARRSEACERVRLLCTVGGQIIEGRRRPTGKRSRTYRPLLCAPLPTRHPARREAELDFVMSLQITFHKATDRMPALTAHHATPGPFARMMRRLLQLAGAPADAVGLINELNRRGREMSCRIESRRAAERLSTINS